MLIAEIMKLKLQKTAEIVKMMFDNVYDHVETELKNQENNAIIEQILMVITDYVQVIVEQ